MGTNVVSTVALPPAIRRRFRPAVCGASLWVWHGHDMTISRRNLVEFGLPALMDAGVTPGVGSESPPGGLIAGQTFTYMRTQGVGSRLQAAIAEPASFTLLVAARSLDTLASTASRPAYGGWHTNAGGIAGAGFSAASSAIMRSYASFDNAGATVNDSLELAASTWATWRLWAQVVESGVGMRLHNLTDGTQSGKAQTLPRLTSHGRALLIGGNYGKAQNGFLDVVLTALYPRALTTAELTTLHTVSIRPLLLDTRGILV